MVANQECVDKMRGTRIIYIIWLYHFGSNLPQVEIECMRYIIYK